MLDTKQIDLFRKALEEKKEKIKNNLNITSSEMNSSTQNNPKDEGDHASMATGYSVGNVILNKQFHKLLAIERSLQKIEDGEYGICDLCAEPIHIDRLKVKIFADYCISCREIIENQRL